MSFEAEKPKEDIPIVPEAVPEPVKEDRIKDFCKCSVPFERGAGGNRSICKICSKYIYNEGGNF